MYFYVSVVIIASFASLSSSIAVTPSTSVLVAVHNPLTEVTDIISKTVNRLWKGTTTLIDNFREADRLKKLRKKYGDDYLTFSEYKFIERSRDDFNKLFRLGITLPISPQFFLYSYILFPMFTPSNPWAWRSFPSTYDFKDEKVTRSKIINKRRVRGVFNALTLLEQDYGENTSQDLAKKRAGQLQAIKQALKASKLEDSLNALQSWLQTEQKKASKLTLRLDFIPGAVISDCCKALGMDALPNLPLIRRFNVGELSGYCKRLQDEDSFLSLVGLDRLIDDEVSLIDHSLDVLFYCCLYVCRYTA